MQRQQLLLYTLCRAMLQSVKSIYAERETFYMAERKKAVFLCGIVAVCCAVMLAVDGLLLPPYAVKSAIKVIFFLACPLLFCKAAHIDLRPFFKLGKKTAVFSLGLGAGLFLLILGAYALTRNVFDFSKITGTLTENIGVDKDNFLYVSLYISFMNSFLEEFFFRVFAFLTLRRFVSLRFAYLFSAASFTVYHVAMMSGWFGVGPYLLVLAGLFIGGLLFDFLNQRFESIYASWFVHMFANFAINCIGFMLFAAV